MRNSFVSAIAELMDKNDKVVLLIGDIGAFLLRNVSEKHPTKVINMGISEAAMMSAAVGLALDGWVPFVYTITPFVTSRVYDQIRTGVGYHNANVKIVGVGSGISYSALGATHHSIEDIALFRSVPKAVILSPSDGLETFDATIAAAKHVGPVYLRLMLNVEPLEIKHASSFQIGKSRTLINGNDITIIATGELVREALGAAILLKKDHINAKVINMSTIKPIDSRAIIDSARKTSAIFTVEEHNILGGLGSAVSETLLENMPKTPKGFKFKRIGIQDKYINIYGHKKELYKSLKLDSKGIRKTILATLNKVD